MRYEFMILFYYRLERRCWKNLPNFISRIQHEITLRCIINKTPRINYYIYKKKKIIKRVLTKNT